MAEKSAYAAKPSSLAGPVPGGDAEAAAAAFLAQSGSSPEVDAASAAAASFVDQGEGAVAPTAEPGLGMQALDAGVRVLDYAGGIARTGLAQGVELADQVMGGAVAANAGESTVTAEDWKNALKGKAPESAEYLRRLGVGEGGSLELPGLGRVTMRGATGLALDIATDPLTAITKLSKAFPAIKKVLNVPGKAAEALGEAVYKSALSNVDKRLAQRGAGSVGEALIETGAPVGGAEKLAAHVNSMSETLGKVRQGLYDRINQAGVTIDTAFPLKRAEATIERLARDYPTMKDTVVRELREMLDVYKSQGKATVDQVSRWKSTLYESLPKSAWGPNGKLAGPAKQFKAALAADLREIVVEAGNKAEKGLGHAVNGINEKWGTLLDAAEPMTKEAFKAAGGLGKMIDGAVLAAGGPAAYAKKKAFDLAISPAAKTAVGRALMEAGRKDVANRLARQSLREVMGDDKGKK